MTETTPIYLGEARLIRWAHSDSAGRTITLQLPEDEPRHPFEGVPTGKEYGQRMQIVCVAMDDHEQPVDAKHAKRKKLGKAALNAPSVPDKAEPAAPKEKAETKRSSRAYLMCKGEAFQEWLFTTYHDAWYDDANNHDSDDAITADNVLKSLCGITSKSELDVSPEAAARFDALRTDFEMREFAR